MFGAESNEFLGYKKNQDGGRKVAQEIKIFEEQNLFDRSKILNQSDK